MSATGKTLLVLDPGLQMGTGHNLAMAVEIARAVQDHGHRIRICGRRSFVPDAAHPAADVVEPVFALSPYDERLHDHDVLASPASLAEAVAEAVADLRGVDLVGVDLVLMPTCSPLHVIALEQALRDHDAPPPLAFGMILPLSFWASTREAWNLLGQRFREALDALANRTSCVYYSETGEFELPGLRFETPVLLPPQSAGNAERTRRLVAARPREVGDPVRFGFFGPPFYRKGIEEIAEAAVAAPTALRERVRFVFRLPPDYDAVAGNLSAIGPHVEATSRATSNEAFLAEIAAVDVALCLYDPAAYTAQISGIAVEAITVGTPLIVSDGVLPVRRLLNRYAPLSYLTAGYSSEDLLRVVALPAETWSQLANCARSSSELLLQAKSAARFLSVIGFL